MEKYTLKGLLYMFKLLSQRTLGQRGAISIPGIQFIQRGIDSDLEKTLRYYRTYPTAVLSDHLLVTILNAIQLHFELPYNEFVDRVYDESQQLSMAMKLTSPTWRGGVRSKSTFYNDSVMEIITTLTYDINIKAAVEFWLDLQPVKVYRHPFTDLSMAIPNGKYPFRTDNGVAVINVDIPMLALMYRRWYEEEKKVVGNDVIPTPKSFIAMFVLPNMLFTHFDLAVFNRMDYIQRRITPDPMKRVHPFVLIDYTRFVDAWIKELLKILADSTLSIPMMLIQTPLFFHKDLFMLFKLPDYPQTRQIDWAILVSKINLIRFLLDTDDEIGGRWNKDIKNLLMIDLRDLYSDKIFFDVLPKALKEEVYKTLVRGMQQVKDTRGNP